MSLYYLTQPYQIYKWFSINVYSFWLNIQLCLTVMLYLSNLRIISVAYCTSHQSDVNRCFTFEFRILHLNFYLVVSRFILWRVTTDISWNVYPKIYTKVYPAAISCIRDSPYLPKLFAKFGSRVSSFNSLGIELQFREQINLPKIAIFNRKCLKKSVFCCKSGKLLLECFKTPPAGFRECLFPPPRKN